MIYGLQPVFSSGTINQNKHGLPSILQPFGMCNELSMSRVFSYSKNCRRTLLCELYFMHMQNLIAVVCVMSESYRKWCMYSSDELFQRSREGYFGRNKYQNNTRWAQKQFVCCGFEVWFTFFCCHRRSDGNMVINSIGYYLRNPGILEMFKSTGAVDMRLWSCS